MRINDVSPAHTRFSIFANMIPQEMEHREATRASIGSELTLRNEEITPFVERLQPDVIISRVDESDIQEYVPDLASIIAV